jgi:triphosphatase
MTLRSDRASPAPPSDPGNSGGESREVEWQLAAPDLAVVRRWLDQHTDLHGLRIEPLPTQQLRDTYLDTEDWRVFRAGFALRLRENGDQVEATLKGLRSARDDVADRRELTEPMGDGRVKALAQATGPVGSRVRDVAGVKPLRPLFEVRTSRQRFAVRRRSPAAEVGEIALDEAHFSRGNDRRRPMVLTRVELEAKGPDPAPLEQLAERLRTECELRPATENKFAVGLRAASLDPPRTAGRHADAEPQTAAMDASTRAGEFAAAALGRLVGDWEAEEPLARLGESPEALHALRVTGRRMATVLDLFSPYLPASLGKKGLAKLKRLLDALGAVRDVDIRLEAANRFRGRLAESDARALEPLLRHLESERGAARARMLRALDAKPTRRWLETLPGQLAAIPPPRASTSPRNAAALDVVPELIRSRYRKLRKCARRLNPESSLGEYHKVRVRTKKLRYALEVLAPTYGKPAEEMLSALHKLQNKLGTQHDSDVVAQYLTQLAKQPPAGFSGETLFLIGRMAEHHARDAAGIGRKVAKPWRRVRGKHWRALRARSKELRDGTPKKQGNVSDANGSAPIAARAGGPASRDVAGA